MLSVVSPIRSVPDNVLLKIFDNCSSTSTLEIPFADVRFTDGKEKIFFESNLSTIIAACSHWRFLAMSTPQFWTNFSFNQNYALKPEDLSVCELASRRLLLSGSSPLRIQFDYDSQYPLAPFGKQLSATCERWENAKISTSERGYISMFGTKKSVFPILREAELRLVSKYWPVFIFGKEQIDLFKHAPLQKITIGTEAFWPVARFPFALPLQKIQDFTLVNDDYDTSSESDALEQLQRLSTVKRVSLERISPSYDTSKRRKIVSSVNHLDISQCSFSLLFLFLRTPNLISLKISQGFKEPTPPRKYASPKIAFSSSDFHHFLSQASSLTSLELVCDICDIVRTSELLKLLSFTPGLKRLHLHTPSSTTHSSLFHAMRAPESASKPAKVVLLPKLRTLTLDTDIDAEGKQALVAMLSSRRSPYSNPFVLLRLGKVVGDLHEELEVLKESGLRVKILA